MLETIEHGLSGLVPFLLAFLLVLAFAAWWMIRRRAR